MSDLFAGQHAERQEATIDEIVEEQKTLAAADLMAVLRQQGPARFSSVVISLLQAHMLRQTNIKDICIDLAQAGEIENTWGGKNRKPRDGDIIKLKIEPRRRDN